MAVRGVIPERFDPLVDFDGLWTLELAERYLPIDGAPPAWYEAVDGKMYMSPRGVSATSWARAQLTAMRDPAHAAGHAMYMTLDVRLGPTTWIEPDLVVLRDRVVDQPWVCADDVLMPVEVIAPSSRQRNRFDRMGLIAREEIPFYLLAEIDPNGKAAAMRLYELADGKYRMAASGRAGETFSMKRPFEWSVDPAELLE